MAKKHHFFLLRHCVRWDGTWMDSPGDGLSSDMGDYIGIPLPNWNVGEMDCTANGLEMVEKTGAWLISSGTIDPGTKVKWEIVADAVHRDIDSAYFISTGIKRGLQETYGDDNVISVGLQDIHYDARFSDPDFCKPTEKNGDWLVEVENRLKTVPQPNLSFYDALVLAERIVGSGKAGKVTEVFSADLTLDHASFKLTGAPTFLERLGSMLFMSHAAGLQPPLAPEATTKQIFQMLQFHHWYRSMTKSGTAWDATYGGIQVQALIHALRHGFYQHPLSTEDEIGSQDDYDTSVTFVLGHDGDLDCLATAMGVSWVLDKPYISGTNGTFLPTPPMSGIHAVRDVINDKIDLSYIYPTYAKGSNELSTFALNKTGILETTPLLFHQEPLFTRAQGSATHIKTPKKHPKTSVDILEDHALGVLARYSPRAEECYHKAVDYWSAIHKPPESQRPDEIPVVSQIPNTREEESNTIPPVLMLCAAALAGVLVTIFFALALKRAKKRLVNRKYPLASEESSPVNVTVSEDMEQTEHDDAMSSTSHAFFT